MSTTGKHRGWLLVYELQYWLLLIASVFASLFSLPGSIFAILLIAAFWGIPIWSLYRSTDAVRRGHIIWCWIVAAGTLLNVFTNPPNATDQATRLGEYFGSALVVVLWLSWALYWQKSMRVKSSYPAPDQTQEASGTSIKAHSVEPSMKCTNCDANVSMPAKFCPNCGGPTHALDTEVATDAKSEKPRPSRSLGVWLVIVGIALVGMYASLFIPAVVGQEPTTNPPAGLYAMVWTSLFFYLGWKYRNQIGWHGALIGAGIGILVYTGAIMVAVSNSSAVADKAGAEQIVDMMEELYAETGKINPDGTPALIDKKFAPSEDATGSMVVMQQFVADMANQSAALTNDYVLDLQSIGLWELLEEERLRSDPTFKKSWYIIAQARSLIDIYETRGLETVMAAKDRIKSLDLSDADKKAVEDGFIRGVEGSADFREKMWGLERLTLDEFEKVIDLLAEDPQSWEIDEGQFLFESDQQIDRFNEHMTNIDKFVAEQTKLQELQIRKQRQKIEELN